MAHDTPAQTEKPGSQKNEHRAIGRLVWVDSVLIFVTVLLAIATVILAFTTYREIQENRKNAGELKEKAEKLDSRLSDVHKGLSDVYAGVDEIAYKLNVPGNSGKRDKRPIPSDPLPAPEDPPPHSVSSPSIAADCDSPTNHNCNCGAKQKGDRWFLPQVDRCYFLMISVRNQEDVYYRVYPSAEFSRKGSSWRCTPTGDRAVPPNSTRDISIDLKQCFRRNQQDREGDIEFAIKTNAWEEER